MQNENTPNAQDIMNRNVQTVGPEASLQEVIMVLLKHEVSNVSVVERDGKRQILMGFVSEGDCLEYLANELFYGNPSPRQTAGTIMKRHPVCIDPTTDVFTIASILTSHRYRHLPVVQDQELLGIVSRRDILRALDQYCGERDHARDRERFPVDIHKIMNHRFIVSGK